MSRRIILLTDLWGMMNADWLHAYTKPLSQKADLHIYDSRELAGIDLRLDSEEELHKAFVEEGIKRAVKRLVQLEQSSVEVLAFSIGGTIAWKAALQGLQMTKLYAISATRLRKETQKPDAQISLRYGADDVFRPDAEWERSMSLDFAVVPHKTHDFYRKPKCAERVLKEFFR